MDLKSAPYLNMGELPNYLTLILFIVFASGIDVLLFFIFKRKLARIGLITLEVSMLLFWLFGLTFLLLTTAIILVVFGVALFVSNTNESREYIANNLIGKRQPRLFVKRHSNPESLFDREAIYKKVEMAVIAMSKQKVGAIITFEKKDSLDELLKSGTVIDAPVTAELLQTIFYPGTRLHDGAVVIRNGMIVAASVYFTPTTRPLTGKFGSRHRAAIGVSENCDAVTVVVSEETGRISIAYQGDLRTVNPDVFLSTLEDYMNLVVTKEEE